MLKVFFDADNIGMITDMLDAEEHSHYPIQLFLSIGASPSKGALSSICSCNFVLSSDTVITSSFGFLRGLYGRMVCGMAI